MAQLTICYSNHRMEMMHPVVEIMSAHDVIVLEEPPIKGFQQMLAGKKDLHEYSIESESEFPQFTVQQCIHLQGLHACGKTIYQSEPYLEHLLNIQLFLADAHSPSELTSGSVEHKVYQAERHATAALLGYYQSTGSGSFESIIAAMVNFARADADRFLLRDTLRCQAIINLLERGRDTCIEAGPMHRPLHGFLQERIDRHWSIRVRHVEQEMAKRMKMEKQFLAPGDLLTLGFMDKRPVPETEQRLLCARTLIYNKIILKEELIDPDASFPHLKDETRVIALVSSLDVQQCRTLHGRIKHLPTLEARRVVLGHG